MKCDRCNRRGVDCRPFNIWGEDFMLCEDCYINEAERGI